ncbi:MAG: outer membrane beta-barrel protein [Fulvivirga sp.]
MSNMSDNELDKLFKNAAEGFDSPYDGEVWSSVESKLGGATGGGLSYFKQIGGVLVGIVLLVSFLIGTQSKTSKESSDKTSINTLQFLDVEEDQNFAESSASNNSLSEVKEESIVLQDQTTTKEKAVVNTDDAATRFYSKSKVSKSQPQTTFIESHNSVNSPAKLSAIGINHNYPELLPTRAFNKVEYEAMENDEREEREARTQLQFGLKAIYAPDLSSVGYFSPDKPGSNFGLVAEVYLANHWFASTGAILSHKIYNTDKAFESYNAQYAADYVDAECRVLDIPLNIGYSVFRNENHSFYVSTGLSSYIMLSEDYQFESGGYYPNSWSENYKNENNHYFGILNLSIGYERKISRQFFIQLEPFLKSPLVGVGEGKVDLVSSGAMFNLKYVFSKANRP